jgi:hypothetical protein
MPKMTIPSNLSHDIPGDYEWPEDMSAEKIKEIADGWPDRPGMDLDMGVLEVHAMIKSLKGVHLPLIKCRIRDQEKYDKLRRDYLANKELKDQGLDEKRKKRSTARVSMEEQRRLIYAAD